LKIMPRSSPLITTTKGIERVPRNLFSFFHTHSLTKDETSTQYEIAVCF
jgi:hypothetical protein